MKGSSRTAKPTYLCQTCGHHAAKWMGFCPQCRASEPLVETVPAARAAGRSVDVVQAVASSTSVRDREPTGIAEFDRVLGGGIVPGAALLLGGWGVRGGPWPDGAVGDFVSLACFLCTLLALPLCFIALVFVSSHHGRLRIGVWALAVVVAGAYAVQTLEEIRSI